MTQETQAKSDAPWLILGLALLGVIAASDYIGGHYLNTSVVFPTVLLVCWRARSRRMLWLLTALAAVLTIVIGTIDGGDTRSFWHRVLALGSLLVTAIAFHHLIGVIATARRSATSLENQSAELQRTNVDLAAREHEIATQNEELRSQTEELERQSEELRVANEELARRERTLEALLRLSRSLTAEMSQSDTLDRICQALGEMINGPHLGVGVKLLEEEQLKLVCHYGFGPEGPATTTFDYQGSFARLVIERNHSGYLEDIGLRPDIGIPQPKSGDPFRSILAAPLRVNGRAVGTLEVYSRDRRTWSDEQMSMIESLAAQTSISLQAAELFARVDRERGRLRAVLETIPTGIAIANRQCTDIRVNPAGAALLGVPVNENIAAPVMRLRFRILSHGLHQEPEAQALYRACQGEVITTEEVELIRQDGHRRHLMVNAAPIFNDDGQPVGAVAAFIDVTDQKQLQYELDSRRRSAEESSVRKSRFLAQVSHDIRNPVNAISLLAELLLRAVTEPTMSAEVPNIAGDLRKNAMSLVNLISDVLDLTRFDTGRIDLEETDFLLNELLDDECRTYSAMAADKKIEFICHPPEHPLYIRADRVKLSRVLGNLLSNAMKFTEKGRVEIRAGHSANGSDGGGSSEGGGIWICISDTGPGIAPEFHQRIFDEFFQLRNNTGHRGSGLGLAISKRLVEAMGGSIELKSAPGEGSSFTVTLSRSMLVRVGSPATTEPR